jgi:RNA polymerase sigma-70 factor (ECF subfamily)
VLDSAGHTVSSACLPVAAWLGCGGVSEPGAIEPAAAAGPTAGSASAAGAPALTAAAQEDARLLARALGGDAGAVRELLDRLLPVVQTRVGLALMRRQGQARGRSLRTEVEDLGQEVFLALFERDGRVLRGWQPERGLSLKGFVGLVAEREAGCILRTGKRSPFTEEPTADDTLALLGSARPAGPAGHAEVIESRDLLEAVVDRLRERLSPHGFWLFQLLYVEERSVEETCAATGLTADAVYAWRSRIGKLARQVRDEVVDERNPTGERRET